MKTTSNSLISAGQDARRVAAGGLLYWVVWLDIDGTWYRYSTRACTLDGNVYSPLLLSPGDVARRLGTGIDAVGRIDGTELVFANHGSLSSGVTMGDLEVLHQTYRLEGRKVRVGMLFGPLSGLTESDIIWLAQFRVDDLAFGGGEARLDCVDDLLGVGELPAGRLITASDWPDAPSASYGKMAPVIVGSCKECPLIAVATGQSSTLDGSLAAGETTVAVEAISAFPDSGTVIIEDEEISYAEKGSNALGTAASPVVRGANGTEAAFHPDGATVAVKQDAYDFLVADHECLSVGNVRVGGKLQVEGTDYSVTTREFDGRTVTVVRFTSPPRYRSVGDFAVTADTRDDGRGLWDEDGEYVPASDAPFAWSVSGDDNLGDDDAGLEQAGKVIDAADPRDGAALIADGDRLEIQLDTDLSEGRLGELLKARAHLRYFSRGLEFPTSPVIEIKHGATEIRTADLVAALPEETEVPALTDHAHILDGQGAASPNVSGGQVVIPRRDATAFYASRASGNDLVVNAGNAVGNTPTTSARLFWFNSDIHPSQQATLTLYFDTLAGLDGNARVVDAHVSYMVSGDVMTPTIHLPTGDNLTVQDYRDHGCSVTFDADVGYVPPDWQSATGYGYVSYAALTLQTEDDTTANVYGQSASLGGATEKGVLVELAETAQAASSLAVQTVTFTDQLDSADRWAVFDGTFTLGVYAPQITEAAAVFITGLWLELEYKQATLVVGYDAVTGDVQGVNAEGWLLDNPASVIQDVLIRGDSGVGDLGFLGLESGDVDATAFGAAYLRLRGELVDGRQIPAFKFNRRIGSQMSARELLAQAARDCRSALYREGLEYRLDVMDQRPQAWVFELDKTNTVAVEGKAFTPTDDVINSLTLGYDEDYNPSGESTSYDSHVTAGHAESQAASWGLRQGNRTARWLHNQASEDAAFDCAAFWVGRVGVKHTFVTIRATMEAIALERNDPVLLDLATYGLNNVVGVVHEVAVASLSSTRVVVRVSDWSSTCWMDSTENAWVQVTPGNQAIVGYANGVAVWRLDSAGNWYWSPRSARPTIRDAGFEAVLGCQHELSVDVMGMQYYDADTSTWMTWYQAAYNNADGDNYGGPAITTTIKSGQDLSGETPNASCVYGEEPVSGRGNVLFTLGGEVLAKYDATNDEFLLAGSWRSGGV